MDLSLALLTGFLSSLHCAGMCGPLVLAYSSQPGRIASTVVRSTVSHLLYNLGRILAYGIAGGILGLVGGTVGALRGVGAVFSGLTGVATIVFALYVLRGGSFVPLGGETDVRGIGKRLLGLYRASFGALIAKGSLESKFYIGLLTPLLPCGLLYGMLVRSAGAGSVAEGAMMMVAFGAGIVPALGAAGVVGSFLNATTRRWADSIAALLLLLMGVSLVWRAVMAGIMEGGHAMH